MCSSVPVLLTAVNQMKMRSASMWLGIMGGVLMVLLMARGFRGAIMMWVGRRARVARGVWGRMGSGDFLA